MNTNTIAKLPCPRCGIRANWNVQHPYHGATEEPWLECYACHAQILLIEIVNHPDVQYVEVGYRPKRHA